MKVNLRWEPVTVGLSLMAAILFGAYVRLRNITKDSLWLDELFSVAVSQPENTFRYVYQQTLNDVHPPFFQMVLWGFYKIFGFGEMNGRYLSATFGVMLIPAMFMLGRQLFNVRIGLYASWLTAINFYLIVYSQELRSYSLLVLLATVSFVMFTKAMRTLGWLDICIYSIVAAMLVNTHYFGFLIVFAQALLVLISLLEAPWDKKRFYCFSVVGLFMLLCIAPQIPYMSASLQRKNFWISAPAENFFIELFVVFFGSLPLSIMAAVLLIVALIRSLEGEVKDVGLNVLVVWVVVCIAVPYLRSLYAQPVLTNRNLIVLLPAILLLVAFGLGFFKGRLARIGLGILIFSFSMTPLFTNFRPVQTAENQLKPVSQMRDLLEELIRMPVQWPMYSSQFLEFGVYLRLLGSTLNVRSHDQLKLDLLSKERPANFFYLIRVGAVPPDEDFMRKYCVVLLDEKRIGDSIALEFHSLDRPTDTLRHSAHP